MKTTLGHWHFLILMAMLLGATRCTESAKHEPSAAQKKPKLIKTIGNPGYGHVRCGLQDRAGNLWFGTTENGLYKFDGKSFRQFLVNDGLNSNSINDLLEDPPGNIWIGTDDGVCLYDGKAFSKIAIPLPPELPKTSNRFHRTQKVYDILLDRAGKLWFATIDGLYVRNGETCSLFEIKEAANGFLSVNDKVEHLLEDNAGNIWFGGRTNDGVFRYDGTTITHLKLQALYQNGPTPKPHQWAWPQLQDKDGNIWFSNWGGAYRYDGKSFTAFSKAAGLPGIVTRIIQDRKGNLWFGGDGICRYDGTSFTCFTKRDGLPHPWVWSVLEDKLGNLWIGTWETGLSLYDGKTFTTYSEYKN